MDSRGRTYVSSACEIANRNTDQDPVPDQGHVEGDRYRFPTVEDGPVTVQRTTVFRHGRYCSRRAEPAPALIQRDVLLQPRDFSRVDILADFPPKLFDVGVRTVFLELMRHAFADTGNQQHVGISCAV